MTLPATGNAISLGDIADEFGVVKANVSLRNRSDAADFDTPDFISEFYSFTHVYYTFFVTLGYGSSATACSDTLYNNIIYGDTFTFFSNTRFWSDSSFTSPFNGGGSWYSDGTFAVQIDSDGNVTNSVSC
jgi:hypothetical protein